jgi:hypothetical protein
MPLGSRAVRAARTPFTPSSLILQRCPAPPQRRPGAPAPFRILNTEFSAKTIFRTFKK